MKIPLHIDLSPEQAGAIREAMRPGVVLMGRVARVWMSGEPLNDAKAGSLFLELGAVPEAAIPGMRKAIEDARENPAGKAKRRKPQKEKP